MNLFLFFDFFLGGNCGKQKKNRAANVLMCCLDILCHRMLYLSVGGVRIHSRSLGIC